MPSPFMEDSYGNKSHRLPHDVLHSWIITESSPKHVQCQVVRQTLREFQTFNRVFLYCHGCLTHIMRRQFAEKLDYYQSDLDEARRRWSELIRAMNRIPHPSAQGLLSLGFVLDLLKTRIW